MSDRNPAAEAVKNNAASNGTSAPAAAAAPNFLRDIIREDLKTSKYSGRVQTRFVRVCRDSTGRYDPAFRSRRRGSRCGPPTRPWSRSHR